MVLGLSVPLKAGQPRFPFPKTPDQIWQNDLDLNDKINNVTSTSSVAGSFIQNTSVLQSGATFFISSGTAVNFNATIGIFQKVGISSVPFQPLAVKGTEGTFRVKSNGDVEIGETPSFGPNSPELVITKTVNTGDAAAEIEILNPGDGSARIYTEVQGTATALSRAFTAGVMGTGLSGHWWGGGPPIANTLFIQDDQNALYSVPNPTFLFEMDGINMYVHTTQSSQNITFVANTSTMAILTNGNWQTQNGTPEGECGHSFVSDSLGHYNGLCKQGIDNIALVTGSTVSVKIGTSSTTITGSLSIGQGTLIQKVIASSATSLNFPNTVSACSDAPVDLKGATSGDICAIGVTIGATDANTFYTCFVSATDIVTVRFCTNGVTDNPAAGDYKVMLTRF